VLVSSSARDLGFTPIKREAGREGSPNSPSDEGVCPFDPHLIQASVDLGSYNVLPDGVERMVASSPEGHESLHVVGLQRSGASAC